MRRPFGRRPSRRTPIRFEQLESRLFLTAVYSVANGDWSDVATWSSDDAAWLADPAPPTTGDEVTIRAGDVVTYDQTDTDVIGKLEIDGKLSFDTNTSVTLTLDGNLVVEGELELLPSSHTVSHTITFTSVDESAFVGGDTLMPLNSDVGLWVMGDGILDAIGSNKTSWTRLTGSAFANDTTIQVADATGWQVGDRLEITPTQPPTDAVGSDAWTGYDSRTITAINGTTITLNATLTHDHPEVDGKWKAEVLNLTRNVVIQGTETGRSHVMFNRTTQVQTIKAVEIRHMGPRQSPPGETYTLGVLGRYGIHFHMNGNNSDGTLVEDVVIHNTGNHAFVTHLSHGITIRDSISHDTFDEAFWWDTGASNATDNTTWDHNVASLVRRDMTAPTNKTFRLTGFWLSAGEGNVATDNVAVGIQDGVDSSGFEWPEANEGVWAFTGNLAHNNKDHGIFTWQNTGKFHEIEDFVAYHNGRAGVSHGAYKNPYVYKNMDLYGNKEAGFILHASSSATSERGLVLEDMRVDGADISEYGLKVTLHIPIAGTDRTIVRDSSFVGYTEAGVGFVVAPHTVGLPERFVFVNNTFENNNDAFHLSDGILADSLIIVQTPEGELFELRRADQTGTLITDWNARRTDLPPWSPTVPTEIQTYTEDFTGVNGAAWPANWTITPGTQTVTLQNNEGEIRFSAGNVPAIAIFDPGISGVDAEMLNSFQQVKLKASSNTFAMGAGLVARRTSSNPDTYYAAQLERIKISGGPFVNRLQIYRVVDGESFVIMTTDPLTSVWNPNTWYNLQFDVEQISYESTRLRTKLWEDGTTEPATWTLEVTDSRGATIQNAAGGVGVIAKNNVSSSRFWRFDDYQIDIPVFTATEDFTGTNGAAWPSNQWTVTENNQDVTIQNNRGEIRYSTGAGAAFATLKTDTDLKILSASQQIKIYGSTPTYGMVGGLFARRADTNNDTYYTAELSRFNIGGGTFRNLASIYRVVDGVKTSIAQTSTSSDAWNGATWYQLRLDVEQSEHDETTLRLKLWEDGTTEPINWTLETVDTQSDLQNVSGRIGILGSGNVSTARYWRFDDYKATVTQGAGGQPMRASSGMGNTSADLLALSDKQIEQLRDAAIDRWRKAGITEEDLRRLDAVAIQIRDLPDDYLGHARSNRIELDINAAGHGWYVDLTPFDDAEFNQPDIKPDGYDLLTVLMHEMGHQLGLADQATSDDRISLMDESLQPGMRLPPTASLVEVLVEEHPEPVQTNSDSFAAVHDPSRLLRLKEVPTTNDIFSLADRLSFPSHLPSHLPEALEKLRQPASLSSDTPEVLSLFAYYNRALRPNLL